MKSSKWLLLLLFIYPALPAEVSAQPEIGPSRYMKSVSEARNRALTNTVLPLVSGLSAVKLFRDNRVQTVGATLAIYGLVMGPSGGNFYAEDYLRGGLGVVARAGIGYFLLLDATRELMGKDVAESMTWDNKDVELTDTRVLIGATAFLGTMVYNVLSSKASVNEFNNSKGYTVQLSGEKVGEEVFPVLSAKVSF